MRLPVSIPGKKRQEKRATATAGRGGALGLALAGAAWLWRRRRKASAPDSYTDINAGPGIVILHGEVGSAEEIAALVAAAEAVDGVKGVQSLLHTPSTA
jgi:MYXO-CTERM domain-containing protein